MLIAPVAATLLGTSLLYGCSETVALRALFPGGLYFEPAEHGGWTITGAPCIEAPVMDQNSINRDPTGT